MIQADQPQCFPGDVIVTVSSKSDGTMLNRLLGFHHTDILENRMRFCKNVGVSYGDVVYQEIIYDKQQTYDTLLAVGANDTTRTVSGVHADGLLTTEHGVGLFLPVADCAGTVVYDPVRHVLALLHLGRHSTLSSLIEKTLEQFVALGSDPQDVMVWMSPSVGKENYKLDWFDYEDDSRWQRYYVKNTEGYFLDLTGYNTQQFIANGIQPSNITISPVDTANDPNYFSHMAGDTNGRVAVLAMMR